MPASRIALFVILCFTYAAQAQDNILTLPGSNPSFRITSGSTFSASGTTPGGKAVEAASPAIKAISTDLNELLVLVRNNHVSGRNIRTEALVGAAISSMLEQLDPHSNYYDPTAYKELVDDQQGLYSGVGTLIASYSRNGVLDTFVLGVSKNTPAERAGLKFGDRIMEVNGESVSGLDSLEVRNRIRGTVGSTTRITIERTDGSKISNIPLRREQVAQKSVPSALMLEGNIGYLALTEGFGYTTLPEFNSAFVSLKQKGIGSLVLDLRGNGGGLMDQAIRIAERFLPAGQIIVSQRGRHPEEDRIWKSTNVRPDRLPLVLLVDENTASASEIIAGAMQDNDRATIIGDRTYGKGLVQDIIPLSDGSMLTLTSERYYTPSGRSIQREYSDSGLYDYFRHTNKADLIGRSATATRTRNGRVVYGGDGIQPDLEVKGFEITPKRSDLIDRLFFHIRGAGGITDETETLRSFCGQEAVARQCAEDMLFIRSQLTQFESYTKAGEWSQIAVLRSDPQVQAAIRLLSKLTP